LPMTSLALTLGTAAAIGAACWILSLVSKDYSWVDRVWSIAPFVYAWEALIGHFSARGFVMAVLATAWGVRLTYNFARKGGYSGQEDYRWGVLRARMSPWQFQLFNIAFIVIYQNALLWLIATPASVAAAHRRSLNVVDLLLAVLFLLLLAGETIADQQQWNFHRAKKAASVAGKPLQSPFCTSGLFRYSRHPNYFCEIAQWWVFCLFGLNALGGAASWLWFAPLLLTLLFVGSTHFTETISLSKYPSYVDYQRRVSAIIPWFEKRRTA